MLQGVHRRRTTKKRKKYKNKRENDSRDYKDKGKRCYIVEEDSDENGDAVVYVAMKAKSDEDEATTLVTYVN